MYPYQNAPQKRSTTWIWIVAIVLLIVMGCCVVGVGGGYLYLRSQDQVIQGTVPDISENPQNNIEPTVNTPTPVEAYEEPVPQAETVEPQTEPQNEPEAEPQTEAQTEPTVGSFLMITSYGVWSVDETTHESVQLSYDTVNAPYDLQEGMSADKQVYAYITGFGGASLNPLLIVLDLENQTKLLQLELTGPLSQPSMEPAPGETAYEATRAMEFPGSLAWSPDGQKLAFVSAQDGDSADVYLYDRGDGSVTRLSEEGGHAASLHWSPDGQFIEYMSVFSFGTGAGLSMDGLWVYDVQNQQTKMLEVVISSGEEFVGWMNNDTFLINSWGMSCEAYNLRAVNVVSVEQTVIVDGCFTGVAYNTEQHRGLLSVTDWNQDNCNCGTPLEAGLYTFGENLPLSKFDNLIAYSIISIPEGGVFAVTSDGGLQNIYDENGSPYNFLPEVKGLMPYPAPAGDYWAWASYYSGKTGLWMTENNANPVELLPTFTGSPVWSQDGQTIYFYESNQVYFAKGPQFSVELLLEVSGEEIKGLVK